MANSILITTGRGDVDLSDRRYTINMFDRFGASAMGAIFYNLGVNTNLLTEDDTLIINNRVFKISALVRNSDNSYKFNGYSDYELDEYARGVSIKKGEKLSDEIANYLSDTVGVVGDDTVSHDYQLPRNITVREIIRQACFLNRWYWTVDNGITIINGDETGSVVDIDSVYEFAANGISAKNYQEVYRGKMLGNTKTNCNTIIVSVDDELDVVLLDRVQGEVSGVVREVYAHLTSIGRSYKKLNVLQS